MAQPLTKAIVLTILCLTNCRAVFMRNNALMNEMVSHFQQDNNHSAEQRKQREQKTENPKQEKIISTMQNVLCKNFPKVPCDVIMEDETLKKLIEKSIQQIKYKTVSREHATQSPFLTVFPFTNSEELSNFIQDNDRHVEKETGHRKHKHADNHWHEKSHKNSDLNEPKRSLFNGRKKIRKFYPHKIKYKDKTSKNKQEPDYSHEKVSTSVEIPGVKRHHHLTYKAEPDDAPVWRIDYTKHGEPSLNNNIMLYEDDRLKGKLIKAGPNVVMDENVLDSEVRKDVLHPDVYIKKKYVRQTPNTDSEGMD